ncbi:MAG: cephalosporin hydroxylase [Acidimicrobiia bacterium]|nr:cephalosporin hydroxylase [Acidimicrobiia bacterium]
MKRPEQVRRQFHLLYHKLGSQTFNNTRWLGVPAQKCPLDMWVLQEILHETQPDVLVETGTYKGGSAYYYASLFDLMNHGRIITVDIEDQPEKPAHPRITYLLGSSTGAATVAKVKELIRPGEKVMVLLDSDHTGSHVKRELDLYSPLVTPGAYLIVEDTHFNGHPILPNHGPGPWEAVQEFLTGNAEFAVDNQREKFLLTFNPDGFLRRR